MPTLLPKIGILGRGRVTSSWNTVYEVVIPNIRGIVTTIMLVNLGTSGILNARIFHESVEVRIAPIDFSMAAGYKADLLDTDEKIALGYGGRIELIASQNEIFDYLILGEEQIL